LESTSYIIYCKEVVWIRYNIHIKTINNKMNDLQGGSNDIKMLAELLLKEVILAKKDNDFDFIEKPRKYVGSRDPHLIEAWIQSVEGYSELKGFDAKMMAKLGITLISGAAKV